MIKSPLNNLSGGFLIGITNYFHIIFKIFYQQIELLWYIPYIKISSLEIDGDSRWNMVLLLSIFVLKWV
jgi:hypothetical protein